MSDPIFQPMPVKDAALRVVSSCIIGPLLGVAALVTFFNVSGWPTYVSGSLSSSSIYPLFGMIMLICLVGVSHVILMALLSTAYSWKQQKSGYKLIAACGFVALLSLSLYFGFGANYATTLLSAFALIILAFESIKLAYSELRQQAKIAWSNRKSLSKSAG